MTKRLLLLLAIVAAVPGTAQDVRRPLAEPSSAGTGSAGTGAPPVAEVLLAQLSIHERIVIRIPRMRRPPDLSSPVSPGEPPQRWVEKRGERCVQAEDIAGAIVSGPASLDLMMVDGERTRALLAPDCPALDYYLGFYIRPTGDRKVCAGRDPIRSRSGAVCPIRGFRRLVPQR